MKLSHTEKSGCTLEIFMGYKPTGGEVKFYRHVNDGRAVGAAYWTLAEALADTNDYVLRAGWLGSYNATQYLHNLQGA